MKLVKRFAFYGAGFIVGLILLFFFLGGKKASCDYGFDARTLKDIRSKKIAYTASSEQVVRSFQLDSTDIQNILTKGDVDFSETDRSLDSCKIYLVNGPAAEKNLQLKIKNCNKTATILAIKETED